MQSSNQNYEAFVAVVRLGTVTAAALELGLPRPTVSRQIARLEADLGVALLHRTTRRISTTAVGQDLFERVRPLLEQWAAVEALTRQDADIVVGTVRISVLPLIAPSLAAVLGPLQRQHPKLVVEVIANVRLVNLRTEGIDLAVWAGDPRDPDLVSRTLTAGRVGLWPHRATWLSEVGRRVWKI